MIHGPGEGRSCSQGLLYLKTVLLRAMKVHALLSAPRHIKVDEGGTQSSVIDNQCLLDTERTDKGRIKAIRDGKESGSFINTGK